VDVDLSFLKVAEKQGVGFEGSGRASPNEEFSGLEVVWRTVYGHPGEYSVAL
jgi:hypothetical protein